MIYLLTVLVLSSNPNVISKADRILNVSPYSSNLAQRMRKLDSFSPPQDEVKHFDYELMAKITAKNNAIREKRKNNKNNSVPLQNNKLSTAEIIQKRISRSQSVREQNIRNTQARKILHAKYAPKLPPPNT